MSDFESRLQRAIVDLKKASGFEVTAPVRGFQDMCLSYFVPGDLPEPNHDKWAVGYSERGKDELLDVFTAEQALFDRVMYEIGQALRWRYAKSLPPVDYSIPALGKTYHDGLDTASGDRQAAEWVRPLSADAADKLLAHAQLLEDQL